MDESMVAENKSVWRESGGGADNLSHSRPEPHIEHAVGLVEDEHLHVPQSHRFLFHEVNEASRRGDEDVHAVLELLDLRFVGQPADYGEDAVVCGCGDGRAYLADLLGEFGAWV